MSTKKLIRIIACLWLLALALALTCLLSRLSNHPDASLKLGLYTVCGLDVFIILLAVCTYTYFYLKVRKIKRSEGTSSNQSKQTFSLVWKNFKLPCYISLTYIFFNLTSTICRCLSVITNARAPSGGALRDGHETTSLNDAQELRNIRQPSKTGTDNCRIR